MCGALLVWFMVLHGVASTSTALSASYAWLDGWDTQIDAVLNQTSVTPGFRTRSQLAYTTSGTVWLYGGYVQTIANDPSQIQMFDLWEFNVNSSQWMWRGGYQETLTYSTNGPPIGTLPGRRQGAVFACVSGQLFIFGGLQVDDESNYGQLLGDFWSFDTITNSWRYQYGGPHDITTQRPSPRADASSYSYNSGLWLLGGQNDTSATTVLQDLWQFTANQWTLVWNGTGLASEPKIYEGMAIWGNATTVWVYSGTTAALPELWQYNVKGWTKLFTAQNIQPVFPNVGSSTPMSSPGARASALTWFFNTGFLYFKGGYYEGMFYSDKWHFNLSNNQWFWENGSPTPTSQVLTQSVTCNLDAIIGQNIGPACLSLETNATYPDLAYLYYFDGQHQLTIDRLHGAAIYSILPNEAIATVRPPSLAYASSVMIDTNFYVGFGGFITVTNDLWVYSTTSKTWSLINTTSAAPKPCGDATMWTNNSHIWLFGGGNSNGSELYADMWRFSVVSQLWEPVQTFEANYIGVIPTWPSARADVLSYFDGTSLWMIGGYGYSGNITKKLAELWQFNINSQSWTYHGGMEMNDQISSTRPGARYGGMACGNNQIMWIYGGNIVSGYPTSELWEIHLSSDSSAISFSVIGNGSINYPPLGETAPLASPGPRSFGAMFYIYDGLLLIGGGQTTFFKNDVWFYYGNSWYFIGGDQQPYPYADSLPFYTSATGRAQASFAKKDESSILMYGGIGLVSFLSTSPVLLGGLWEINLEEDQIFIGETVNFQYYVGGFQSGELLQDTPVSPGARGMAGMTTDGTNYYLYGGYASAFPGPVYADLWEYQPGARWVLLSGYMNSPAVDYPSLARNPGPRANARLWYFNNCVWLFGGMVNSTYAFSDVWKFDLSSKLWDRVAGPSVANDGGNITNPAARVWEGYATNSESLVIFGGMNTNINELSGDMWIFNFSSNSWTPCIVLGANPNFRLFSTLWVTQGAGIWLYGGANGTLGAAMLQDLWHFDGTSWSNINLAAGPYGVNASYPPDHTNPSPAATPGPRVPSACSWYYNGSLYLYGGGSSYWPNAIIPTYSDVWRYDIVHMSWYWEYGGAPPLSSVGDLEELTVFPACAADGIGRLSMFGGIMPTVGAYDPPGSYFANGAVPDMTKQKNDMSQTMSIYDVSAREFVSPSIAVPSEPVLPSYSLLTDSIAPARPASGLGAMYADASNLYLILNQEYDLTPPVVNSESGNLTSDLAVWRFKDGAWKLVTRPLQTQTRQYTPSVRAVSWINGTFVFNFDGGLMWYCILPESGTDCIWGTIPANVIWPPERQYAASWIDGTYLWMFGGKTVLGVILNDLWKFDTLAMTWIPVSGVSSGPPSTAFGPGNTYFAQGTGNGTHLWIYGGKRSDNSVTAEFYQYDIKDNYWTLLTNISSPTRGSIGQGRGMFSPGARFGMGLAHINNSIYLYGGAAGSNGYFMDVWKFDKGAGIWFWIAENGGLSYLSDTVVRNVTFYGAPQGRVGMMTAVANVEGLNGVWFYGGTTQRAVQGGYEDVSCGDLWFIGIVNQTSVVVPPPSNTTTGTTSGLTTGGINPICGNRIVEQGEQCDSGLCCYHNCTFKAPNTPCRNSSGVCDLSDTCSGQSSLCYDENQGTNFICNTSPCTICGTSVTVCPDPSVSPCTGPSNPCLVANGGCDPSVICSLDSNGNRLCGMCQTGTIGNGFNCTTLCGDGNCDPTIGEDCVSCYADCKTSICQKCGDGSCDSSAGELCSTCHQDCGPCGTTKCSLGCSGHGTCNNGQCICTGQWTGPSCSTPQGSPITVQTNDTSPNVTLGSPVLGNSGAFFISINNLVEADASLTPVRSVTLTNVRFGQEIVEAPNYILYNYSTRLENKAFVNVMVWKFNQTTSLTFAGITTQFDADTLKVSVTVQQWPFLALTHSLGIDINASASSSVAKSQCVNNQKDSSGNLRWIMVIVDKVALYGQFLDQAVVDERFRNITYSLIDTNTVRAYIPHFWSSAEMDPHFNVLLGDTTDGKCPGHRKGVSEKTILLAVFLTVGLVALLIIALLVIIPRLRLWWQVRKMQKVTSSDGISMSPHVEKVDRLEVNSVAGTYRLDL